MKPIRTSMALVALAIAGFITGGGARLMMLVHHDDAEREYAYGAESKIGTFNDALIAEVKKNAWSVISMKNDWKRIFAFEK